MNDRFKFRVWDNIDERYILTGSIDIDKGRLSVNGFYEENRFFIEQCTGLKDKNGKLVFWGDLLKDEYGRIFTYKELWKDKELICFWQNINFKDYFQEEGYKLGYSDKLEVIGNIHQNRELLEKGGK